MAGGGVGGDYSTGGCVTQGWSVSDRRGRLEAGVDEVDDFLDELDVHGFLVGDIFECGPDIFVSEGGVGADLEIVVAGGYFEVFHNFEVVDDSVFRDYLRHQRDF
jgi:hypothetical protein